MTRGRSASIAATSYQLTRYHLQIVLDPNCMMRGSPAWVVMRPNVPALKFAAGLPQLKWFNRLNDSRRSSSRCVAPTATSRESARSMFQKSGPTAALRSRSPSVPGAGCANAARLK